MATMTQLNFNMEKMFKSLLFWNQSANLKQTVYLLRIFDYCRPGTVFHLNIIVII